MSPFPDRYSFTWQYSDILLGQIENSTKIRSFEGSVSGLLSHHSLCVTTDNNHISKIKVCYDKSLTRVDCDGIKGTGGEEKAMMGTCLRFDCLTIEFLGVYFFILV